MFYNNDSDPDKLFFNDTATAEQIKRYSEQVRRSQNPCQLQSCPRCQATPEHFKRHDKKRRKFFVIVKQLVDVVIGLLTCWKCPGCGKCFTGYHRFSVDWIFSPHHKVMPIWDNGDIWPFN